MSRSIVYCAILAFTFTGRLAAQPKGFNYDEAKVPEYTLPPLLKMNSGADVTKAEQWPARRAEIMELYQAQIFGRPLPKLPFKVLDKKQETLADGVVREQVTLTFGDVADGPKLGLLIMLPKSERPVPVFFGPNFPGNQTVSDDPGIPFSPSRPAGAKGNDGKTPQNEGRGSAKSRWAIDKVLARGYGFATICYHDMAPDDAKTFRTGVMKLFPSEDKAAPGPEEGGAINAWAWGLSRCLDYMETDPRIDAKRVVLHGHSRLGKAALWAGALDERLAIVISNNSGEGGAAITRRKFGETLARINTSFPHWFCGNHKKYDDKENDCPVDAHMLIALAAPRPIYVCSAQDDQWADPKGEYLAAHQAGQVYELLGKQPLPDVPMPEIEQPVHKTVGYHIRKGKHDVTDYDWEQWLNFADQQFERGK